LGAALISVRVPGSKTGTRVILPASHMVLSSGAQRRMQAAQ